MAAKKLIVFFLALTVLFAFIGCSNQPAASESDSDVAYIQDKGKLIVGITDFKPMDYKDESGEWIGFDADLAKLVAEKLGVSVEFVVIDWGNKILELENKSVDVIWNGMTINDETLNGMTVTQPYCKNSQVVVMNAEKAANYSTAESMTELLFVVENGSAGEKAALAEGFQCNSVDSQAAALMEVAAGTSDACVIDLLMAGAMIGEGTDYPNLVNVLSLTDEDYGIGCRKGSDLAEYIDGVLDDLYADGTLMELAEQYGVQKVVLDRE